MTRGSLSAPERLDWRSLRVLVKLRIRQGRRRVRNAIVPVTVAAIAAGLSWGVAYYGLDHQQPFFAPVAAWVCLGFNADRQVRKVAELAIGVSLGVALGEVIAAQVGTGVLQIILVIIVGALLARFIDRGYMLTVQAGVQGTVIVALPAINYTDGAAGRWMDALVGGAFALLVAVLTPRDARRRARQLSRASLSDLAQMLSRLAEGVGNGDQQQVRDALAEGRGTQAMLDEWSDVVRNARQSVRLSPTARRYLPELSRLQRVNLLADRAIRNARVVARRGLVAVEHGRKDTQIAEWLTRMAHAAELLGDALATATTAEEARAELASVARELAPDKYSSAGWRLQTLVIIMRSLAVDLLQATGMSANSADTQLAPDEPQSRT